MQEETQEESNLKNLKTIAFFRAQLWKKIKESREFDHFEVSILDSQCPGCKNFVDSMEMECNYCNFQFSEKSTKLVKKFDAPGKGKKQCLGCGLYLAVRTGKCDCGYDFIKKIQTATVKKEVEISNKKKKKSCYYEIKEIKDVNLLIKNDIINNNFLGLIKFIEGPKNIEGRENRPKKISQNGEEILSIINLILKIRNELIKTNYRLVTKIASGYLKRNLIHLKIKDLYQTGTIGLLKAINHYNSEIRSERCLDKSISFSTYAHWWITKSIIDDINNTEREIRIPQHILNVYKDFNNYYNKFVLNNEREPYIHEIKDALGLKDKKASGLLFAKHYKAANTIGLDVLDLNKDTEDTNNSNFKFKSYIFKHIANELTTRLDDTLLDIQNIDFDKIKYDKPIYRDIFYSLTGLFGFKELNNTEAEKEYGVTKVTIARIREKTIERIKKQLSAKKQEDEIRENPERFRKAKIAEKQESDKQQEKSFEFSKIENFPVKIPSGTNPFNFTDRSKIVPWMPKNSKYEFLIDPQRNDPEGRVIEEITIETTIEETIEETETTDEPFYEDDDDEEIIRTFKNYTDD